MPKIVKCDKENLKYIEKKLLICMVENQPNNFVLT
jgi:hypothetical protein